ncbi:MAG: restriction endonuclease subunit S [Methanomicrobium sp.]|nr:restriction endonuclease subunit S [Methanomicrobium sp.]
MRGVYRNPRGFIDLSKIEYIPESITPKEKDILKYGDLLFNTRNTLDLVGKVAIWRDELPIAYYNSNLMHLIFKKEKINSTFFANYFFNSFFCIMNLRGIATGTTSVAAIYTRDLLEIPFIVPPLPEQTAIATVLSDTDALIASLDKLIAKKKDIKQAAMQELLTGKRRLPGFEEGKGYKQTDVGMIPEDWTLKELGSICKIYGRIGFRGYTVNDIVTEGKGAIAINPSNIQENKTDFSKCTYISWKKYEESPEIKINEGDVLLVKTGSTFGKTAIVQMLPEKATINPQLVVLKKIQANNSFLSYVMAFPVIQNQILNAVVGGALPTLSQKLMEKFILPLPSLSEQTAIASILSDMDD